MVAVFILEVILIFGVTYSFHATFHFPTWSQSCLMWILKSISGQTNKLTNQNIERGTFGSSQTEKDSQAQFHVKIYLTLFFFDKRYDIHSEMERMGYFFKIFRFVIVVGNSIQILFSFETLEEYNHIIISMNCQAQL